MWWTERTWPGCGWLFSPRTGPFCYVSRGFLQSSERDRSHTWRAVYVAKVLEWPLVELCDMALVLISGVPILISAGSIFTCRLPAVYVGETVRNPLVGQVVKGASHGSEARSTVWHQDGAAVSYNLPKHEYAPI